MLKDGGDRGNQQGGPQSKQTMGREHNEGKQCPGN